LFFNGVFWIDAEQRSGRIQQGQSNPLLTGKRQSLYTYKDAGDKYLGCIFNILISKYIPHFLVFYYRSSGIRY